MFFQGFETRALSTRGVKLMMCQRVNLQRPHLLGLLAGLGGRGSGRSGGRGGSRLGRRRRVSGRRCRRRLSGRLFVVGGVQARKTRFKFKAPLYFQVSNFETGRFQARVKVAPPPPRLRQPPPSACPFCSLSRQTRARLLRRGSSQPFRACSYASGGRDGGAALARRGRGCAYRPPQLLAFPICLMS